MTTKRIGLVLALAFFTIWLLILWAGADHPPPPGFLWLILLDAVAAGLVYARVPTYLRWQATRPKHRLLRVLVDGVAAGLALAAVVLLANPGGEPGGGPPAGFDLLIWFTVVGAMGAVNALLVYLGSVVAARIAKIKKQNNQQGEQ